MPRYRVVFERVVVYRTFLDVGAVDAAVAEEAGALWASGDVESAVWDRRADGAEFVKSEEVWGVVGGATRPFEDVVREERAIAAVREEAMAEIEGRASTGAELHADYAAMRDRVAEMCLGVLADQGDEAVERMAREMLGD
jgi:hypothetical protein